MDVIKNTDYSRTLVTLKSNFGEDNLQDFLALQFIALVKHFQVSAQMPPESLRMGVKLIIRDYWWYSMLDFKVFFEMAIMGKFGTSYNRIDMPVIFDWLSKYDEIRTSTAEMLSQIEAHSFKSTDTPRTNQETRTDKIIDSLFKK